MNWGINNDFETKFTGENTIEYAQAEKNLGVCVFDNVDFLRKEGQKIIVYDGIKRDFLNMSDYLKNRLDTTKAFL